MLHKYVVLKSLCESQTFSKGKSLPDIFVDGGGLQVLKFRHGQEHSGGAHSPAK